MSVAPSTWSTYQSGVNSYQTFCAQIFTQMFPLTEINLQRYVVASARRLSYKTLKVYLAGVQYQSFLQGFDQTMLSMPRLHYTLRGIRREQGNRFARPRRIPVTVAQLHTILHRIQFLRFTDVQKKMFLAAASLAFFGMLRSSEYTCTTQTSFHNNSDLAVHDVWFSNNHQVMFIRIKASKTDPFRAGCVIRVGATGTSVCPIALMDQYLSVRPVGPGPLFWHSHQRYLTRNDMVVLLRSVFPTLSNVNTHSFRIGGASSAASAGISDSNIQILGRWTSDAYRRYLHFSDLTVAGFTRNMAHSSLVRTWDPDNCLAG